MTSSESCQAVDGGDQPIRSPLSQAPAPVDGSKAGSKPLMGIKKETQAMLTYIKQSPKKVNLVAELVRGMRVDDALMQMAVSPKRAAKVVAKVKNPSSHVESTLHNSSRDVHIAMSHTPRVMSSNQPTTVAAYSGLEAWELFMYCR